MGGRWITAVLCLGVSAAAAGESVWVAVAARTAGVGDSRWVSEVAILNPGPSTVALSLRLHTGDGLLTRALEVEAGAQKVLEDVVGELGGDGISAALEVAADGPLAVTSRTYNLTDDGRFGQGIAGVRAADGFVAGEAAVLAQLRQEGDYRTNLGVLNMGAGPLEVAVSLVDRLGAEVGEPYLLQVPGGCTVMDNRPFVRRYGRTDIVAGSAVVRVRSGGPALPFASVVDGSLGDPTTVWPRPYGDCEADIGDRLAAIGGMTVEEGFTTLPGYRFFRLQLRQPADHADPAGAGFVQHLSLLHRDDDAAMVLHTAGYQDTVGNRALELTAMLEANQLTVEHRFFGASTPAPADWGLLTVEQAAADHHRVVEALRPIYAGAWLSTGASKGGMAAIYHRRHHPDDVDGTVAYVAPNSIAAPDPRYPDFLAGRGDAGCRAALAAGQRELLLRRAAMVSRVEGWASSRGHTYHRIGGSERAFESAVVLLPFTFWVYAGVAYCAELPAADASDDELFLFLRTYSSILYPTDAYLDLFGPYFYQAQSQLGFPDLADDHLGDLLLTDPPNLEEGLPPEGTAPTYDGGAAMLAVADWVAAEGSTLLLVYGENDAWTAAAFDLGDAVDSYRFTVADGTHRASIARLDDGDRVLVEEILGRWTGAVVKGAEGVAAAPPPGRPEEAVPDPARALE